MNSQAPAPSFSIIIPTHQRRDVVCDTVRAVAQINYNGPFELLVVVDGSIDGTFEALGQIECPFPFSVINQVNCGAAHARNRGAENAVGEILLFLDDDMECDTDILRQHAASYHSGADAVLGHIKLASNSPTGFLSDGIENWSSEILREVEQKGPTSAFQIYTGHMSVRADMFRELGGFDEAFTSEQAFGNEDADFGVRLLEKCGVRYNPCAVSYHRYVVTPRQNMAKAASAARADVHFVRKHPQLELELMHLNGAERRMTRLLYRPLSRIPYLGRGLGWSAAILARFVLVTPWRSNRAFARFFYAARSIFYWSQVRASQKAPKGNKVLILCYHLTKEGVGDPVLDPYAVEPANFERQIASLWRRGFQFISPDQLLEFLDKKILLPDKSVLLTFDDCYVDLVSAVQKTLKPRAIPSIAFAVSGMESGTNEWDQAIGSSVLSLLDAEGLSELEEMACEVGCHSRTHRDMTSIEPGGLAAETLGAANDIAATQIKRPRFFAYPFGSRDAKSMSAVHKAGFLGAFGLTQSFATPLSNRFDLPRVNIDARHSGWRFWVKTVWPRSARLL